MAVLTFPCFAHVCQINPHWLISWLTDWDDVHRVVLSHAGEPVQWMSNTLSSYLLSGYFKTVPASAASLSSHHSLCPFSHPFRWQSRREHYPHHYSISFITADRTKQVFAIFFSPPCFFFFCFVFLLLKEKRQDTVLDYCAQSWYFHGEWGGWAYKSTSTHINSSLTCDLRETTASCDRKTKNGCEWRKRGTAVAIETMSQAASPH